MFRPVPLDFRNPVDVDRYFAELTERICVAERRTDGFLSILQNLARQLDNSEKAVTFLQNVALRPEDRPPQEKRSLSDRLRPDRAPQPAPTPRDPDLEARCAELERKLDTVWEVCRAAEAQIKALMPQVDALEKKCLTPSERQDVPVHLRNLYRPRPPGTLTT